MIYKRKTKYSYHAPYEPQINSKTSCCGQSVLELIIAMAIFGLISAAMISMVTGSFVGLAQGGEQTQAESLAQEGIEAVKAIYGEAWNQLVYSTSSVSIAGGKWIFDGEGTTETIGQFTRTIFFTDVCRDSSNDITDCPGNYTDAHTKEVNATVLWDTRDGVSNTVERAGFVTNWDSREWTQTGWSGGTGQSEWSDTTRYDTGSNIDHTTVGQVTLSTIAGGGCGTKTWPFTTASNYTYDPSKIEVTGGVAELLGTVGVGSSGDTINPDFDTDTVGWTYNDWEQAGGADVTGSRVTTGGNPNGYVNINIPGKKNTTLSGFWEQSFTTTVSNPSIATTTFDWIATQFSGVGLISYQLYVFVDSSPGAPTLGSEVWSSGEISGTTSWASVPEIDVSSKLGALGTYYLKIAARTINSGQKNPGIKEAGFDNVSLHWESVSYPTDRPTINPNSSFSVSGIDAWTSFTETATKNGGEVYYQLSDDEGSIWQYWNGSDWATAGASDFNIATDVNVNISLFATSTGKIVFKAFLESDGTQLVQLDNVRIGWGEKAEGGGFAASGFLISSAFDMSNVSPVQIVEWDETIPSCTPACTIMFQVSTAPDVSGSPGAWTSWYGATGAGTFFTDALGVLISTDLNGNEWVRYRTELSGDQADTPVLNEIRINYK